MIQATVLRLRICLCLAIAYCCVCCGRSDHKGSGQGRQASPLSPVAALGRQLFFDPGLSASGKLACASCHDPRFAYGPSNSRAVQLGGPSLKSQGNRAVPSLRYTLDRTPRWMHVRAYSEIEQLTETDSVPTGGFTSDGRFNTLRDQATFPLFAANEMANRNAVELAAKLAHVPYSRAFVVLFGKAIFSNPSQAVAKATEALEQFELEDRSFHPFSSRFDAWMDGKAMLTHQEMRGKRLFDDPNRGNCASCHLDNRGTDGSHPIFTDFQFEGLGVPRNPEIPANANPAFFDMGLCGPLRTDTASENKAYCGLFKTPTLRNVTSRKVFFHNGRFHSLREALRFYVQRDTNPERWYAVTRQGKVRKFDDLPSIYRDNMDVIDSPLTLHPGQMPVWNHRNIDDVIAFLRTLKDDDVVH
ncbi:cytochrome-c peroxidase [Granulicella sp. L60]|uniref:cytochrome-c peroxidase n=1 Tax=Granulicella sp. L60 TaxID=1641866 RepID=UPI00131E0880|nr:cytochrome c peroxidase [Granulicella sp. L60]